MNKITSAILASIPLAVALSFYSHATSPELEQQLQQIKVSLPQGECANSFGGCRQITSEGSTNQFVYYIELSGTSALDAQFDPQGSNRRQAIQVISNQQSALIAQIKALDSHAIVVSQSKLVSNALTMQLSKDVIASVQKLTGIKQVTQTAIPASFTSDVAPQKYPQLNVKPANGHLTVAIVGNGVDYTHRALGGSGTRAAYELAWENRSNAFDGFPTETVIGGLDFAASSEGYHSHDYNPIEDEHDANVANELLPSGTVQAAIVLQQAPDARIYAYKTYDWDWVYFTNALDFIIDPNQDGDIADRPDIVLLNSYGNGAFYQSQGSGASAASLIIDHIRRVSALGSLVVVPAGSIPSDSFFNLAWAGAAPDALTVGSVEMKSDGTALLSSFTPAGPVRGSHLLKPEVVGQAEGWSSALVGTGEEVGPQFSSSAYAAAQVAGIAAKTWQQHRDLSAIELKALLANTANSERVQGQAVEVDFNGVIHQVTPTAEVPFLGSGLIQAQQAGQATAMVWDAQTQQPNLSFGFAKVTGPTVFTRNVTVKNLSGTMQRFNISSTLQGNKPDNSNVKVHVSDAIQIAAHSSVTFPVSIEIDGDKLSGRSIMTSDDYTVSAWLAASLSGVIQLQNASQTLVLPWNMLPIAANPMARSNHDSSANLPFIDSKWQAASQAAYNYGESNYIDVKNDAAAPQHMVALPLMLKRASKADGKADLQGHHLKDIGATIKSNTQCSSGEALTIGINFFDPIDLPMAEHFDKAGSVLTYFKIYDAEVAEQYKHSPKDLESYASDDQKLAYFEVGVSDSGQLVAEYVDFNLQYDRFNPRSRYKQSKLPVYAAAGGRTLVVSACLDELFHGPVQSNDAFNAYLGWQFATDRDAQADIDSDVLRFNPRLNGYFNNEVIDHTGEDGYPNWWDFNCQATQWNPNNCIEQKTTFAAAQVAGAVLPSLDALNPDLTWQPLVTIPAGGTARFLSNITNACDQNQFGIDTPVLAKECPAGVMFANLTTGDVRYGDAGTPADNQVVASQAFLIPENSVNGSLVGRLALDVPKFFYPTDYEPGELHLLTALPGTPFVLTTDGQIKVNNSQALDYETTRHFEFEVQADFVNRVSQTVSVSVDIADVNDVAPTQLTELKSIQTSQGQAVSANLATAFMDQEGQGLSFVATGLPAGITLSELGMLSGNAESSGQYQVQVTVSDGVNQTVAPLVLVIEPKTEVPTQRKSGGAFSIFSLLCLMLVGRRHRRGFATGPGL